MCATDSTPWAYWAVNHFSPPWFHRPFYPVLLEKLSASGYNLKDSHWLSCSSTALICSDCQQIIFLSEVPSIHTSFAFLVLKVLWERSKALSFFKSKRHISDHNCTDYPDDCLKQRLLLPVSVFITPSLLPLALRLRSFSFISHVSYILSHLLPKCWYFPRFISICCICIH